MCAVVSNRQPVLYFDELVGSDRGPVATEIVYFLSALFLSFQPFNPRAPPNPPHSQQTFTFGFDASLGLLHTFARVWDAGLFDLLGELFYHCRDSGVGHPVLGERESQEATGKLIGSVYEYAPAHGTFDMFVPPSTRPMKSREEMLDHAQRTEGVAAVWVGYGYGVCDYLQA